MDIVKRKLKGNLILKTWERCRSFGYGSKKSSLDKMILKSKSWNGRTTKSSSSSSKEEEGGGGNNSNCNKQKKNKCQVVVAPEGCFSVYVGPERQRFAVKTELANHPLFKMLLEDAELEYGYNSEGPILLPCDVDLFYKVLAEIEFSTSGDHHNENISSRVMICGYSPLILFGTPSRHRNSTIINKVYASNYRLLSPSPMLNLNGY